jgi:hypothetical protein
MLASSTSSFLAWPYLWRQQGRFYSAFSCTRDGSKTLEMLGKDGVGEGFFGCEAFRGFEAEEPLEQVLPEFVLLRVEKVAAPSVGFSCLCCRF